MKRFLAGLVVLFSALLAEAGSDYLGQKPPGHEPVLFAPGVVSTGLSERDVAITPDGNEIYFGRYAGSYKFAAIMVVRRTGATWSRPEVAPFSGLPGVNDLEPAFSWDGRRLYFLSDREKRGQDIWYVERDGASWGPPRPLGAPVCSTDAEEYFPSLTRDGTIYFTLEGDAARPDGIYRSRLKDGAYTAPERLPDHVNSGRARYNAFIAPDESYLIYAIHSRPDGFGRSDYYVSFRSPDDTWSEPVNLGPKINSAADDEYSPYVTRDGRYLFFMSSRTAPPAELFGDRVTANRLQALATSPGNGNADIWWVEASFIEALRPGSESAPAAPRSLAPPDRQVVEQIIRDAIGWALTKDRARLESIMAHDGDFFIFHPDSKSTVRGWDAFAKMIPTFMDPRFEATRFEVRELATVFSASGDVAWYSAMLEDCGAWDGKESCWKDTRWTGVLEKRGGTWVIVQMHFSFAKD